MKNGGFLDLKGINPLQVWTYEIGRHIFLFWILGWKDTPLIWATPSTESLYEDIKEGSFCSFTACLFIANTSISLLILELTSFGCQHVLNSNQDPALMIEQLQDSCTFCSQSAIVRLARLQPVSLKNKFKRM